MILIRLKRRQIPILLLVFFSSAYASAREIKRIQIKSTYRGFAVHGEDELIIEKKNSHYYTQKRMVNDTAICALLEAIDPSSKIIEKPDLDKLGLTQTWLNENANSALSDYLKSGRKTYSLEQQKHFLTSFTNLQIMKKFVDEYYGNAFRATDDDPDIEIVVQTDEGKVVEISSRSQFEFMLPWHILNGFISSSRGSVGEYDTWDVKFSRVIAQVCDRLIYKRRSQGHFSPSTGRRRYFLAFQPLCARRGGSCGGSCMVPSRLHPY
jgi:hypothetical protein